MKKFLKTCSVCLLAATFPFAAACGGGGGGGNANTVNDLEIFVLDAGYGTVWCDAIAEAFLADPDMKAKYPELKIHVETSDQKSYAAGQMAKEEKNTIDLLFGQSLSGYYGTTAVLNLTESVYNQKVPGEDVLYKNKMNASVLADYEYVDVKGNGMDGYYGVAWQGGQLGITYNEDVLTAAGVEVPRTSKEFIAACETITTQNKSKADNDPTKAYAIIQSSEADYWDMYFFPTWWAQYDGIEGYNNFYQGLYQGKDGLKYSNEIFTMKGRLRALEEFERIMDYSKGYVSPRSFNDEFMIAQTAYLLGAAAFHVNGVYWTREMKGISQQFEGQCDVIKLMRSPVLSSVIEVCDDTLTTDEELSMLIKAIDEGSEALSGEGYDVSQATFNKIREARFTVNGASGNTMGIIPSHAAAKDAAIDFVRFMATDKALAIYAEKTDGTLLDFDFDIKTYDNGRIYNAMSPLNKGVADYYTCDYKVNVLRSKNSFPLFTYGKITPFLDGTYWKTLTAEKKGKTAQQYYDETITNWTVNKFNDALAAAGLGN